MKKTFSASFYCSAKVISGNKIGVPKELAKLLNLKTNDIVKIEKVEWLHLLDWSTIKVIYDKLPARIKKEIENKKLK